MLIHREIVGMKKQASNPVAGLFLVKYKGGTHLFRFHIY